MKKLLILSIASLFSILSTGQNNVLSLHLLPLGVGELRLGFEHTISENMSLTLNAGYFIQHDIPNYLYDEEDLAFNGATVEMQNSMTGFDIVPEFRRYFGKSNAPEGFYMGLYGKWAQYEFEMMDVINYQFTSEEFDDLDPEIQELVDESLSLDVNVLLDSKIKQQGIGFQMGYQMSFGKHWAFDVYFLGLELDRTDLEGTLISPNVPVDYEQWIEDIENAAEEWDRWPFIEELEFEEIRNGVQFAAKGYMPWFRGGIKIGFLF